MMFEKILIANRGEIAVRIIRAAREMGIKTVIACSEADRNSLASRLADEVICIGPPESAKSYLNIPRIISAAEITGVDAIHPGYGFLAENSYFAEAVEASNIVFIGPPYRAIGLMGDKAFARSTMREHRVPILPGSDGGLTDQKTALKVAHDIGYPIMVKAVAGGGGRGMRIVHNDDTMRKAVEMASSEANVAFGNPEIYLEKYLIEPRHIEIQVIADKHGNTVYLGERECSIQRRHQKLLEEAPSIAIDEETRKRMGEAAVRACKAVGYYSAGTVEFLLDKDGNFYFMEMNTRIQVEHPVTEMVTGIDLIKSQILVAMGEKLPFKQKDISIDGHAIECRINAEDPERGFAPSPGTIEGLILPGGLGVRVDTHIYQGYTVPPYYDSLVAKLICWGRDREEARIRTARALDEFVIEGIKTTIPFQKRVVVSDLFKSGDLSTSFIERLEKNEKSIGVDKSE